MLDFLMISTRSTKKGSMEIYPKFIIKKSQDLMIRGGDFYAVWFEEKGLWSTEEQDLLYLVDKELDAYYEAHKNEFESSVRILHMWDASTGMIDSWHKYCQRQMRDNFHMLDEKIIFSNDATNKKDYASKRLEYPLEPGEFPAYEELVSTLYSPEERHKIEWAIGAIVTGDSKKIQKFLVFYGSAGTGKSTVLNIIQKLFEGYYSVFDAKALGSSNNSFALEAFKSNPLVAIQHDGDLSRIEDNTRLNSLVSHEMMTVNEKFKSTYANSFKCFLFMGTNKPVRITDAKSGLIRRLIDVSPTGDTVPTRKYKELVKKIDFELGAIAYHCKQLYESNPHEYDNYIPMSMLGATNDFYNFVEENFLVFKKEDFTTLKQSWELYKIYCEDAKVLYPLSKRVFKEEFKNYFEDFAERSGDGKTWNVYMGFKEKIFDSSKGEGDETETEMSKTPIWLNLVVSQSILDRELGCYPAQYATVKETPSKRWDNVTTTLSDIDTRELHYVKPPENYIVVDFDLKNEKGEKDYEKNIQAASKWPETYAEVSKGGSGLHLHYIYDGDVTQLSSTYAEGIEIKTFTGKASLRRKLSKCNYIPVAKISSGLPLKKGVSKMVDISAVKSDKALRNLIKRNLNKEIHLATKPSVDFIKKILDDAYDSDLVYDVSDMRPIIFAFASGSTNNAEYCTKLVPKMKFKSKEERENEEKEGKIAFFDVEVFPNLFVVCWKFDGGKAQCLVNPTRDDISMLLNFRLIGFNCRRYDNHILYAKLLGYNEGELYNLSQKIISGDKNCFFSEAYNLSYTDVYDFASAGNKMSLKKLEIKMGIHHQELGLPWDLPVPEDLWDKVAEYCKNDIVATEAAFHYLEGDWTARQILADVAGMTVNDTTNSLTTRIIFGNNRKPQDQFQYRNMGEMTEHVDRVSALSNSERTDIQWTVFDKFSRKPIFPDYIYDGGVSTYRGEEIGEGGYVYAEPGMYGNVALLDVASMHPTSIISENLFGDVYTSRFKEIVDARLAIKHKDFDKAREMLDGKLAKYLTDEKEAKNLANALKTAINSVYGLTAAKFENPFRDNRNKDNIVAKRGALFMVNLKNAVQERGFTVVHIKTDSIKIADATPEIISFVMEYGKLYGYIFEHEATYDRMCIVNDAVYIAKYADSGKWTATGTQFAVPYVFKKLFSKEEIGFSDMCETKSVTKGALYLDFNEDLPENEHKYYFVGGVGSFCPIRPGQGGGELLRKSGDKYAYATGCKGYRWKEAEVLGGSYEEIDLDYYERLVDEAKATIALHGDYYWFVSDDPYVGPEFVDGKPLYLDTIKIN